MDPDQPSGSKARLAKVAELPERLLLSIVSAGVITGLALGAARVWLSARFGSSRRR